MFSINIEKVRALVKFENTIYRRSMLSSSTPTEHKSLRLKYLSYLIFGTILVGSFFINDSISVFHKILLSNISFYLLNIYILSTDFLGILLNSEINVAFADKPISKSTLGLSKLIFLVRILITPLLFTLIGPVTLFIVYEGISNLPIYCLNLVLVFIHSITIVILFYSIVALTTSKKYIYYILNFSQTFIIVFIVILQIGIGILLTQIENSSTLFVYSYEFIPILGNVTFFDFDIITSMLPTVTNILIQLLLAFVILILDFVFFIPTIGNNITKGTRSNNTYSKRNQQFSLSSKKNTFSSLVSIVISRDPKSKRLSYTYISSLFIVLFIFIQLRFFNLMSYSESQELIIFTISFLAISVASRMVLVGKISSNPNGNDILFSSPIKMNGIYQKKYFEYQFLRYALPTLVIVSFFLIFGFHMNNPQVLLGFFGFTLISWALTFNSIRHILPFSFKEEKDAPSSERASTILMGAAIIISIIQFRLIDDQFRLLLYNLIIVLIGIYYYRKYILKISDIFNFPHTKQSRKTDCGLACIAMLAESIRIPYDKSVLLGQTKESLSLREMTNLLSNLSLPSKAFKIENIIELISINEPMILHLKIRKRKHYVVLHNIDEHNATVGDPSKDSNTVISTKKLESMWTGYTIIIND